MSLKFQSKWIDKILVVLIVILLASAHPKVKYSSLGNLDDNFPGLVSDWNKEGVVDNSIVSSDYIAVVPNKSGQAGVTRRYYIGDKCCSSTHVQLTGSTVGFDYVGYKQIDDKSYELSPSLFYFWFEDSFKKKLLTQSVEPNRTGKKDNIHQKTIAIPAGTQAIHIGLLLRHSGMGYKLTALQLELFTVRLLYKSALGLVTLVTIILAIYFVLHLLSYIHAVVVLLVLTVFSGLLLGVVVPRSAIEWFVTRAPTFLRFPNDLMSLGAYQNVGHVVGFSIVGYAGFYLSNKLSLSYKYAFYKMFLLAIFTESIQHHLIYRSPNIFDVLLDLVGIVIGFVVWYVLQSKNLIDGIAARSQTDKHQ